MIQPDCFDCAAREPSGLGAEMGAQLVQLRREVDMAVSAGKKNFLLVESEDIRPAVLARNDVETVVVRVGLAVERKKDTAVLKEVAHRLLHQPMSEIGQHDEVNVFDFGLELAEHAVDDHLFRGIRVDEIDTKKLTEVFAFADRLDVTLFDNGDKIGITNRGVIFRRHEHAQGRLEPALRPK